VTWSRALLEVLLSLLFALMRAREGAGAFGWCEGADGANYAWASPAAMGFNALAAPDSVISIRTRWYRWP